MGEGIGGTADLTIKFADEAEYPVEAVCIDDEDSLMTHVLIVYAGRPLLVPVLKPPDAASGQLHSHFASADLDVAPALGDSEGAQQLTISAADLLRSNDAFSVHRRKRPPLPPIVKYLRREP